MKIYFHIFGLCVVMGILLSGCDGGPFASGGGEFDTRVLPESQRYDLTDDEADTVLHAKFINQSDRTLYHLAPSFTVTVQQRDTFEWKDRGAWYSILQVAPSTYAIEPGDTLEAVKLNLRYAAQNMNIISESGLYRLHFRVYRDHSCQKLIPEADRVSEPFEVIL